MGGMGVWYGRAWQGMAGMARQRPGAGGGFTQWGELTRLQFGPRLFGPPSLLPIGSSVAVWLQPRHLARRKRNLKAALSLHLLKFPPQPSNRGSAAEECVDIRPVLSVSTYNAYSKYCGTRCTHARCSYTGNSTSVLTQGNLLDNVAWTSCQS